MEVAVPELTPLGLPKDNLNEAALAKYKAAADIVNATMLQVVANCLPGADVAELCVKSDSQMEELLSQVYQDDVEKGIALPTCITRNEMTGFHVEHGSGSAILAAGDVVQICLGVQIDGYIAHHGHTHIVGLADTPCPGRRADIVCAVNAAAELVHRLLRPGVKSQLLTSTIHNVAREFNCHAVSDNFSCTMQRFVHEGSKVFLNRLEEDHPDDFVVEADDVYCIDIAMATATSRLRQGDVKPSVFMRDLSEHYQLKTKAARDTFTEIDTRFPTMFFSVHRLEQPKALLGLKECLTHNLVVPFAPRTAKPGEFTARIRYTVVVQEDQTTRLCSHPAPFVQSQYSLSEPSWVEMLAEAAPSEGPSEAAPVNTTVANYVPFDVSSVEREAAEQVKDASMQDAPESKTKKVKGMDTGRE
eukprot:m.99537 g.99537  ORF g.99537 m.99537 type:complete len:416 (-) comp15100_c0_seq13:429-1676(-)